MNHENPQVLELAAAALEQLNAGQLAASPRQLLRVISAHRQVGHIVNMPCKLIKK
jgi:hypothetical protein